MVQLRRPVKLPLIYLELYDTVSADIKDLTWSEKRLSS